jgi:hypothetical protein
MTQKDLNGCHYWDDFFFQKLVQLINSDLSDTPQHHAKKLGTVIICSSQLRWLRKIFMVMNNLQL